MGKGRVFYGWWVVGIALMGEWLCHGSLLIYTFGFFLKPLAHAFGTTRGPTALAMSSTNLAVAVFLPFVGRMADRWGPKRIIVVGIAGTGAVLACLSRLQPPLWHLYLAFALAGLAGTAAGPVPYRRVVASWFDRRRGLALGLTSVGLGLGAMLMPLFAQSLIDRVGWRGAYLCLGLVSTIVALPLVGFFLKERPADLGLHPDGAAAEPADAQAREASGLELSQAIRTPAFWLLCVAFAGISGTVIGANAHLVALLTDRGMTADQARWIALGFGLATIVGRISTGFLIDRFFAPRVLVCFMGAALLGLLILRQGAAGGGAFLAAFCLGLGVGAETDVMPYLVSRYFGLRAMAGIFGCVFISHVVGLAAGSYLLGAGYDATGSYRVPLTFALGALALAAVAALALPRYGPSGQPEPATVPA